jgi:large subunit ribosomal protein L1
VGVIVSKVKAINEASSSLAAQEALGQVVKGARVKFDESVDLAVALGIDASKGEQTVRGSVLLPHGRGRTVRVLVFARGEHEEQAKAAGADVVGAEDLVEKINGGWMEFDAAVATPDMMALVGKVARILGPRGLLPNNRVGTVTNNVGEIVKELKQGRVVFRNDKAGIVHAPLGRVSFGEDKLGENLIALVKAIAESKPATAKGKFFKKASISSTMGKGFSFDVESFLARG